MRKVWELGKMGKLYKNVGSEGKTNISAGFHLSDVKFKCSFETVVKGKKQISPFLQHQLILLLPLLFEIGGKLVPNWEESVETDLFLTSLWFDWEGHGQLKEAEEREKGGEDRWTTTWDHQAFSAVVAKHERSCCSDAHCQQFNCCSVL